MTNGEHGHGRITWWVLLTTCAIVASTSATAAWYVARARIDDELRQYERSKEWQLPALLQELGRTAKLLNLQLQERQELDRLRVENKELSQKNLGMATQIETIGNDRDDLKKKLAEFEADRFDLRQGEARVLVPGELAIGIKNIYLNQSAEVQFGEELKQVLAGATLVGTAGGKRIGVTLVRVDNFTCTFSVSTAPAAER